jgi:hypothetical protein
MSGIRIHHISERGCVLVVPHPGFSVDNSSDSAGSRRPKDYYVHLNQEGDAIVSERVWQRLQEAGAGRVFVVLNEVANPPTLLVGGPPTETRAVRFDTNEELRAVAQQFAPPGVRMNVKEAGS